MTKVYQISVRGTRAALDAPGSLKSKKVFLTRPTPEQINEFIDLATTRDGDYDLTWLKREGLKVAILELELADDAPADEPDMQIFMRTSKLFDVKYNNREYATSYMDLAGVVIHHFQLPGHKPETCPVCKRRKHVKEYRESKEQVK